MMLICGERSASFIAVECWSGSFREPGREPETFSTRTVREPRQRPSFLFWQYAERKGGKDGEATISGAVPTLVLHCSKVLRTNSVVRVVCVGSAALSVCAPEHFGFADGSTVGFRRWESGCGSGCAGYAVSWASYGNAPEAIGTLRQ